MRCVISFTISFKLRRLAVSSEQSIIIEIKLRDIIYNKLDTSGSQANKMKAANIYVKQ